MAMLLFRKQFYDSLSLFSCSLDELTVMVIQIY